VPVTTTAILAGRSAADTAQRRGRIAVMLATGLVLGWTPNRGLVLNPVTLALIWPAVLTVIFLPLAARQYRALGS
jgi:ABC-2 type transport system permease protein